MMNEHPFMKGIGLGMLAGAAVGVTVAKSQKTLKRKVERTAKAMTNVVEDAAQSIAHRLTR